MPVLPNPRHERFCQAIAAGQNQYDAYITAGFEEAKRAADTRSSGAKLARQPRIAERIAEIQARQASRVGITVDTLVAELNDMLVLAKRVKHPAAGVGAILAKGKLLGLIVDRAEVDSTTRKPARRPTEDTKLTMDEWQRRFSPTDGKLQ